MFTTTPCPDEQTLSQWLAGQITESVAVYLDNHFEQCPRCVESMRVLRTRDKLIDSLRNGTNTAKVICGHAGRISLGQVRQHIFCGGDALPDPNQVTKEMSQILGDHVSPDGLGQIGIYRVLSHLAIGGMGIVLLAIDTQLQRKVALKIMRPHLADRNDAKTRFIREAQAMASLRHNHIATIHHVGEIRGVPFLAMELLQGESLDCRIARHIPFMIDDIIVVGLQVADALRAAHSAGLIHRDIKPSNIWIEETSPEGRIEKVKLLDFGLVHASYSDQALTHEGALVGTPGYIAPEQAEGLLIDARSDLFSLGCVLYQMATGQSPFLKANAVSSLHALVHTNPPPVKDYNPDVPAALGNVIDQLIEKSPVSRPASADAVYDILHNMNHHVLESKIRRHDNHASRIAFHVLLATILIAVLGVLISISLSPSKGTLIVETDQEAIEAEVKQDDQVYGKLTISPRSQRELQLPPGKYQVEIRWPNTTLPGRVESIIVPREGERTARLEVGIPRDLPVPKGNLLAVPIQEQTIGTGHLSHWNWIYSVALSPNGEWLASASADGSATIWEAATGQRRLSLLGHQDHVTCVAYHPKGLQILTGSLDRTIKLWNATNGECVRSMIMDGWVHTVVFHPSMPLIAAMTPTQLHVFHTETGESVWKLTFEKETLDRISGGCAFSPDGNTLAFRQGTHVQIVDASSFELIKELDCGKKIVSTLRYTHDGTKLAVGCAQPTPSLMLWGLPRGELVRTITLGPDTWDVLALAFSPRDDRITAAFGLRKLDVVHFDGQLRQWDVSSGQELAMIRPNTSNSGFWGVTYDRDGEHLIGCSPDHGLWRWHAATGTLVSGPGSPSGFIRSMAVGPNAILACGFLEGPARLFDLATGQEKAELKELSGMVAAMEISPDGMTLIANAVDGANRILSLPNGELRKKFSTPAGTFRFSPDGRTLALTWWGPKVFRLKDLETGGDRAVPDQDGLDFTNCLDISPDGRYVATGHVNHGVVVWDLQTGQRWKTFTQGPGRHFLQSLAFSPDGKTLAVGHLSHGACVRFWDLESGKMTRELDQDHVATMAFNRAGNLLATAGRHSGKVYIYHGQTGQLLQSIQAGPPLAMFYRVAFLPDGQRLAVLNGNGTVTLHRLVEPNQ